MEVSIAESNGLERTLKVQIPAEQVDQAIEEKIRRVGQHAKIPGFRPGKVPKKVLYQRYGDGARQEVAGELVQSTIPQAISQVDLKPAGRPDVSVDSMEPGAGLAYTATFDVYPEIELQGLDDIKVERPVVEVTDSDVDAAIVRLREQRKTFEPVEREARDEDKLVIDYEGKIDGEAFEGGTASDVEVVVGEGRFLPDLESALKGRTAGESFESDVTFPEEYQSVDLAGKTAQFSVTIKSVSEPQLPELDDEFLKSLGMEEPNEAELREKLAESLRSEADNQISNREKTQVMDAVLAANPIEVPKSIVAQEMQRMRQEALSRMPEQFRENSEALAQLFPEEQMREPAEKRVALGLLIAEVISQREIELDREKVDEKLGELAAQYGAETEQVKQYYQSNPQMMQGIEAMVMENQVVESLLGAATISDKTMSLDELLSDGQQ